MSANDPKAAWRGTGGAARPGGRAPSGRRKWVVAAVVLAAVGGAVAGLFVCFQPPPEPLALALPVSEYKHPDWPPDPFAEADARAVLARLPGGGEPAFQFQEKARFRRALETAVGEAAKQRRPLVVYVVALGTVHANAAYLLPADAQPDDPAGWLTLDDLLDPLRKGSGSRLLVLDVRPCRAPRAALPTADVNEVLDALLAKKDAAGELPFPVLTANTPPDGPPVLHQFQATAFAAAVAHGLAGGADGWRPDRAKDQSVSARELAAFVREATYSVSQSYGGSPQLPRLHGGGMADFPLVRVRGTPPEPGPLPEYPPWLAAAWADHDAAVATGGHRLMPRAVRQQSQAALRAEQGWLAGDSPGALARRRDPAFGQFHAVLDPVAVAPQVGSIARARTGPDFEAKRKAAAALLRPVLELVGSPAFAKLDPDKAAAARTAEVAKVKEKLSPDLPFAAVAAAVWDAALDADGSTADRARHLDAVLDDLPGRTPLAELAALKAVAATPADRTALWGKGGRAILDAADAAERAAVFDARVLPLVRADLARADADRRAAVAALADVGAPQRGIEPAVETLVRLRRSYGSGGVVATDATRGWRHIDEARAALADLADHYPHELSTVAASGETSLRGVADAYRDLLALLRPAAGAATDTAALARAAERVGDELAALNGRIAVPARDDPRQLEAAFGWPGWTAPARQALVHRLRAASTAAFTAWPVSPSGRELPLPPSRSAEVFAASRRDLENRIAVLAVGSPKRAAELRDELAAGTVSPPAERAKRFSDVAAQVRLELRVNLPATFRATADDDVLAALGWAVDPDDAPALPGTGKAANPERFVRLRDERALARWLAAERHAADAAALDATAPPAAAAARKVAEELNAWSNR